jgi:hypothetical protein
VEQLETMDALGTGGRGGPEPEQMTLEAFPPARINKVNKAKNAPTQRAAHRTAELEKYTAALAS